MVQAVALAVAQAQHMQTQPQQQVTRVQTSLWVRASQWQARQGAVLGQVRASRLEAEVVAAARSPSLHCQLRHTGTHDPRCRGYATTTPKMMLQQQM